MVKGRGRHRIDVVAAAVGIVVLAGLSAACNGGDAAEAQRAGGDGSGGRQRPVAAVEVAPVERGSIARSVTVSGVVEPIRTVGVNSQMAGALLSIHAEEGKRVRAGQPLARLDDREIRAQLVAAEADYEAADAAYRRAQQLLEREVITVPEYERDRTARAAAKSRLDQLRTRAEFAVIEAPIGGVVTEKRVEAGDIVGTQTRLFTVADVSTLVVRVGVSELDVVELAAGDRVTVAMDAYPARTFGGQVRRVFPSGDPTTRLVPVEVALDTDDSAVARPGFLARVTFALSAREDVLLIPAGAVVRGTGSASAFVLDDGRALRRTVTTGLTSQGRVEVVAGLEEGEQVITAGNSALRDGMDVRVVSSGREVER